MIFGVVSVRQPLMLYSAFEVLDLAWLLVGSAKVLQRELARSSNVHGRMRSCDDLELS